MDREREKARHRSYYLAHQEEVKAYHRAHYAEHRDQRLAVTKGQQEAVKQEAFRQLGDVCACPGCGVSEPLFLSLDHIHGQPQRKKRGGYQALLDAKRSGWDKSRFQIMCMNCNFAKKDRGYCPVHATPINGEAETNGANGHHPQFALQL